MRRIAPILALLLIAAAPAEHDARTIISRALEAAGGDGWANAKTLILKGRAVFYGAAAAPRSTAAALAPSYDQLRHALKRHNMLIAE